MKDSTNSVPLIISIIQAALVLVSLLLASMLPPAPAKYIVAVLVALGVGVVLFLIIKKFLERLIIDQMKSIYGTLESYSGTKKDLESSSGDNIAQIVSQVNNDVKQWAKDKVNEISLLKNNEKFRKEFLGNVSHELKTPLFNIQGYISTLVDGGIDDEEINMKYLERTEKNINRLISIVQDLETISKFESGMLKIEPENFDVIQVVREIFDLYEMKAKNKGITLSLTNGFNNPIMVNADKTRIFEVISNLVVNSINYGQQNGHTTVSVVDIENKYLVKVVDDGIGIAEQDLQRVFERFFRVDKSRSSANGGTGLGLAIVKHILEAHGERITVKSKIGEGSTFSFTLKKDDK